MDLLAPGGGGGEDFESVVSHVRNSAKSVPKNMFQV